MYLQSRAWSEGLDVPTRAILRTSLWYLQIHSTVDGVQSVFLALDVVFRWRAA